MQYGFCDACHVGHSPERQSDEDRENHSGVCITELSIELKREGSVWVKGLQSLFRLEGCHSRLVVEGGSRWCWKEANWVNIEI